MIKDIKLSLALCLLLAAGGCKHFEPQVLDDSQQLAVEEGAQKGLPGLSYEKGYLDNFGADISPWWGADNLNVVKVGDTMKVIAKNIGSKYTPFGREFTPLDFSEAPVLRVKARYEGMTAPDLRIDLKDINGMVANFNPPKFRLRKGGYRDYFFNFDGKWKQSWPDTKAVDPTVISGIMFFINPGTADWTGTIFIDEIQIMKVSDIPSKKPTVDTTASQNAGTTTPTTTTTTTTTTTPSNPGGNLNLPQEDIGTKSTPAKDTTITTSNSVSPNPVQNSNIPAQEAGVAVLIDDFNNDLKAWWSSNPSRVKLTREQEMLRADCDKAGPAFESFGRSFKPVDFTKTPVLKVRVKFAGDKPLGLRVDIKDITGFSTNAKPVAIKLLNGTNFADYYFDFTNKYEQAFPTVQKVNPESIVEILLYVNPGGQPYSGTLYIDEIKAISLQDFNNKK